jgi:carbon storage regulator CsrA
MLVVSRRKNEAILIDGAIEIEVVNVTKATVRVRLSAPRSLQVVRGFVKRELGAEAEPATKGNPAGIDTLNLTLVSQQVIELGRSISLGVVDVDRSRALFFVDAPTGTSVLAADQRAVCCQNPTAMQNLLQFMSPPAERGGAGVEKTPDIDPSRDSGEPAAVDPSPLVLPFRTQPASRDPL